MTFKPVESQYSMTATRHGSWEPLHAATEPPPLNPTYPSCPLGVRVSDLPEGWALAGRSAPPTMTYEGAKLTPDAVATIRNTTVKSVTLARRYGVTPKTIYRVRHGLTWKV
jgi:hypothetical protein